MTREKVANSSSGFMTLFVLLVLQLATIAAVIGLRILPLNILAAFAAIIVFICWFGFYLVQPNQGRVLQLFGRYVGTDRINGRQSPMQNRGAKRLRLFRQPPANRFVCGRSVEQTAD